MYFKLSLLSVIIISLFLTPASAQEDKDRSIAFAKIGQPPYPDECKMFKDDHPKAKDCLSAYISEFVGKNFNTNKFGQLQPMEYRISVQFTINYKGKVCKVMARAPFEEMEKEAIRVIKKLPRMSPGFFEGEYVNVLYGLPINFVVPETKQNKK